MSADDPRYLEAIDRFTELLEAARNADLREPTAMTLATADARGRPTARTVLLKAADARGFTFYTNRNSRKGHALAENAQAALLFFWQPLMRQVKIEGPVVAVPDEEADAYWATRPRESQLAALASQQSEPLAERGIYERRLAELRERYADEPVPRPAHWGGYRVVPDRIEFWHEREFRQHDRDCYYRPADEGGWRWTLLYP